MGTTRFLACIILFGCPALVAGCQSGVGVSSVRGVLDPGGSSNEPVVATNPPANTASGGKVLESELRAYCPQVTLVSDASVHDTYETKRKRDDAEDDPAKLVYRSSLSTATRKCGYAPGTMSMEIAVAGKVVPGPLAKDGTVTLPIRIEVKSSDGVLYSNVAKYEVAVSRAAGATQFIYNDLNVSFPTPEPDTLLVTASFDLPKKKAEDRF